MILILKKINSIFKKLNFYPLFIFFYFKHIIKSIKNYLKIFSSSNPDSICIPNFAIKNVIYINPNKIEYVNSIPIKFNNSTKFILDFDWDKNNRFLENDTHPTFITCYELFVEGKQIQDTKNYFYFKDQILKKRIYKNCKNDDDIIKFLKNKVDLFKKIKNSGIKKNYLFNIQFMIDKNFNLVKINSGNHRMAISRILKIKKIPVEIKVIHSKCLEKVKNNKINIKKINKIIKDIENKYT